MDSVHVSGWAMVTAGARAVDTWLVVAVVVVPLEGGSGADATVNQEWNWEIGSAGCKSDRRRPPCGSCLTNCPVGPGPGDGDGATEVSS